MADLPHLSDDEFLAALEAGTLPEARFNHVAHVRALGKSERYHEAITIAFMSLIHGQLWHQAEGGDWEEFRVRNPQLFRSDALLAYYPKQVLESPEARARFLLMPLAGVPPPAGRCA